MMKVVGKNGRVIDMNVNDHSISEVSEHPDIDNLFINFDENLIAPECNTCPIYEWCGGGYLPTRFGNSIRVKLLIPSSTIFSPYMKL